MDAWNLIPLGCMERSAKNKPMVTEQITFEKSVIGLIASTSRLDATDVLSGHPEGEYTTTRRGIEPRTER